MKGQSGTLLIVIIIVLFVMIVAFVGDSIIIGAGLKEKVENRFAIRHEIHTSDNALKNARIYMETASRYSFYQAVYDVFRQGGFREPGEGRTYNYWHDSFGEVEIPSEDDVLEAIQYNTERNLNIYAKAGYNFMSDYSVFIPEYTVTLEDAVTADGEKVDTPLETFSLTATGDNLVIVRKQPTGEIISMEAKSSLSDNLTVDVKNLYEKGKNLLPTILSEMENGMKAIDLPASCPDSYSVSTEEEKGRIKEGIMAITISVPQETGYSFEISMVHSDTKRSPGTTCVHTLLGVARVKIKAEETSIPILNEDGPNFAPVELAFLVRYAYTSTGEEPTPDGLDTEPAPEEVKPPEDYAPPEVVISGILPYICRINHDYDAYVAEASQRFRLDTALIRAVICTESRFDPEAVSEDGAMGLMQLMPIAIQDLDYGASSTYCKELNVDYGTFDAFDPESSIMAGTCYLSYFYYEYQPIQKLDDQAKLRCALATYNAGTKNLLDNKWASHGCDPARITGAAFAETRDYVAQITSWAGITAA